MGDLLFPVSLLPAIQAGEDYDRWEASGAGPFTAHLIDVIEKLTAITSRTELPLYNVDSLSDIPQPVVAPVMPRRVQRSADSGRSARERAKADQSEDLPTSIADPILRSS